MAFEAAGIRLVIRDMTWRAPARLAEWSGDGREVVMVTTLDQDDEFRARETPQTWVLDASSWKPLERYVEARAMALSPDARYLALAVPGPAGLVRVFDRVDGQPEPDMENPGSSQVEELHFAADGSRLAATLEDGRVCIGDVDGTSPTICHRLGARHARLNRDASTLVVAGLGKRVELVQVKTGTRLKTFPAAPDTPLAVSADGLSAAFVRGREFVIVDLKTRRERARKLSGEDEGMADVGLADAELAGALALNQDGSKLAALLSVGALTVWDTTDKGAALHTESIWTIVRGHGPLVSGALAFSPSSRAIFAGPTVLDSQTFAFQALTPEQSEFEDTDRGVAFSTDGRFLWTDQHTVDLATGRAVDRKLFDPKRAAPTASPDGRFMASMGEGNRVVELTDRERPGWRKQIWSARNDSEQSIAYTSFLPDGITLLLAEQEGHGWRSKARLLLVDARNGALAQSIDALTGCDQSSIALAPSGRRMVIECLSRSNRHRSCSTANAARGKTRTRSSSWMSSACRVKPYQGLEASCHDDGVRVWRKDRELGHLPVNASEIHELALGPRGLVAIAFATSTELWSWKTRDRLASIDGPIVRAPDGRYELLGPVSNPACVYGTYVLPLSACKVRFATSGLLKN
jgi:WD40 repeat protein